MSRAKLIAACQAAPPDSPTWIAAVTALGAASRLGFPPPPRRATGLNRTALLYRVTQSHVFDADREQLRNDYLYGSPDTQTQLVDFVLKEATRRKKESTSPTPFPCPTT